MLVFTFFFRLKGYHASKNTLVYFPPESDAHSNILLVYDPLHKQNIKQKQAALAEVEKEILELVTSIGPLKTETVSVEKRWHDAVTGKNRSTLNAYVPSSQHLSFQLTLNRLIGEGRALAIDVGGNGHEDIVVIRGSPADVDRATKDILRIVEEAKNDAIDSSHVVEFQIAQQYIARIVGAAGAGIQKYREQLDVKIDIEDLRDAGEQVVGKKKKTTPSTQSVLKVCLNQLPTNVYSPYLQITGRKQNAEEAKKRILAQVDKMVTGSPSG